MQQIIEQLINTNQTYHNTGMKHRLIAGIMIRGILITKPQLNEFIGVNEDKTHLITIHAEVKAILNYFRKITNICLNRGGIVFDPSKIKQYPKIDLIVIRVNKVGQLLNSRPCQTCLNLMRDFKINKVYYSNNDSIVIQENVSNMVSNFISSGTRFTNRLKILNIKLKKQKIFDNTH